MGGLLFPVITSFLRLAKVLTVLFQGSLYCFKAWICSGGLQRLYPKGMWWLRWLPEVTWQLSMGLEGPEKASGGTRE